VWALLQQRVQRGQTMGAVMKNNNDAYLLKKHFPDNAFRISI
jgi:hypothetical protein